MANLTSAAPDVALDAQRLAMLRAIERKLLWLSSWTIHHANHLRPSRDKLKVGGHQASCASVARWRTLNQVSNMPRFRPALLHCSIMPAYGGRHKALIRALHDVLVMF